MRDQVLTVREFDTMTDPNVSHATPLNDEQAQAVDSIKTFLLTPTQKFFMLRGSAGTGKTHIVAALAEQVSTLGWAFTAPTNKATKELQKRLPGYECKTIYSFLGLRMEGNEDEMRLVRAEHVDLSRFTVVVLDEGSMVNTLLCELILESSMTYGIKYIVLGDPAQLPPINEDESQVWSMCTQQFTLTKVQRHDNQILQLASQLRDTVLLDAHMPKVINNHTKSEGVWSLDYTDFVAKIQRYATKGLFDTNSRVIAWRNRTVLALNKLVRAQIYTSQQLQESTWLVGDRVVFTRPVLDGGRMLASVDEEAVVETVDIVPHLDFPQFTCYALSVNVATRLVNIKVIHESSEVALDTLLQDIASNARKPGNGKEWRTFWGIRNLFSSIRHGYALTAHRAQGSTYRNVFVDKGDILRNSDTQTAYKCLYVACTRASHKLFIH